jgi:GNAT superfamily N-acetyltransferase
MKINGRHGGFRQCHDAFLSDKTRIVPADTTLCGGRKMHDILIRKATTSDAGDILDCLHEAFEPHRQDYTKAAFTDTTLTDQTMIERLTAMTVLVAIGPAQRCIGTLSYSNDGSGEGHLRGMAVLPSWHGRGVAAALLAAAERELADQGCDRITLDTTRPLKPAIRFYEAKGYGRTGVIRDFFGMELIEYIKLIADPVRGGDHHLS